MSCRRKSLSKIFSCDMNSGAAASRAQDNPELHGSRRPAKLEPNPNIEVVIGDAAHLIADQMLKVAEWANSEEDLRHECNKLVDEFLLAARIEVRGRHEYGLAGGRIDSKYGGVIIEYKFPKGPGRIGRDAASPGAKALLKQIKQRFEDFQREERIAPERLFAAGCDGLSFLFVRSKGVKLDIDDPLPVTAYTVERLLRALVSLGAQGKSFKPDLLTEDFGSESPLARRGIRGIHNVIVETDSKKARTFFSQWKILFGEVCGYDVEGHNERIRRLADHYDVPLDASPAELLFSVHTYYAIFMKFLAAEIASSFSPLGVSVIRKCSSSPTPGKLRREMESLEQGGIWAELGITNFLEGDIFSWYLDSWHEQIADAVWGIVRTLEQYDPTTLSVDPAESRDLLKKLYQHLFPRSVRHDLGEYYTPDWLAEFVLEQLPYDGDPNKRLLDPACGSGTFLVMAINKVKAWFNEHRHECGFTEEALLTKVLRNIVGFDLNPLAVMAARTNYLLAIRDLLKFASGVELPVYLCDSIMTPSQYGVEEDGQCTFLAPDMKTVVYSSEAKELKTSAGNFLIPAETVTGRDRIAKYALLLESCIRNKYNPDEFIARCDEEGLPVSAEGLHRNLYGQLMALDVQNQNGIWARIIKNAFAPLFTEGVDYVVGNPPWVNWSNLPSDYRDSTGSLWRRYDLFRHTGLRARLGAGSDDISILMTYVAHDAYLKEAGRLGFVITQTIFKTKGGGEGFRTLNYSRGDSTIFLNPIRVDDMTDFQPFEDATNRTCVIMVGKSESEVKFPAPYVVWKKTIAGAISQDCALDEVLEKTDRISLWAEPVDQADRTSPWLTCTKEVLQGINKVRGSSSYVARKGVYCPTNAIYWITDAVPLDSGHILISNLADTGKKRVKKVSKAVEPDFIHRLVRGKDISRWKWSTQMHIILAQDREKPSKAVPEKRLKKHFPKTFAYFKQFEEDIRSCALLRQYFDPEKDPFYSCYNVGEYTFRPVKVLWKEISPEPQAVVLDSESEMIVPDHKLVLVSFESSDSAHFLCAVLNSSPIRLLVRSYAVQTSISGHVLSYANIPQYVHDNELHKHLSNLSSESHAAARRGDTAQVSEIEADIDKQTARLWGLTADEVRAMQAELRR